MLGEKEQLEDFKNKLPWFFYLICLLLCVLALRLAYLQLVEGETYRFFSQENTLKKEQIPGPRGRIYDRNNELLVDNRLQLDVTVTPQFTKDLDKVLHDIAALTGVKFEELRKTYRRNRNRVARFSSIPIIPAASWETVVKIESNKSQLPGIDVEPHMKRVYLQKTVGSHLFGYLSEVKKREIERFAKKGIQYENGDWIGRSGLEREWENHLRGQDGYRYVVVDAHGHRISADQSDSGVLRNYLQKGTKPKPGKSIVLTIDRDLQETSAEAMKGMLGSTVAMDPRTGEILAMHNNPGFDPTELTTHRADLWTSFMKNPYGPLRNKAIQDHFPPGSTYKVVSALAGLKEKLIDTKTMVHCKGYMRFGRRPYHCHKREGHGWVDLRSSIRKSCDIFYYQLATKIGIDLISEEGFRLGLGKRTGIKLFGEVPGNLPTEEWKRKVYDTIWLPGETLSASIGQGANLVTPLQMAVSYATLVNGGDLYRPYVVSKVIDEFGNPVQRFTPELMGHQSFDPDHVEVIKQGLHDVVNHPKGTAYWFVRSDKVEIAGKSGTAQVRSFSPEEIFNKCETKPFEQRHHGWFVGYAPADKPEIVVSVFGMHACGGSSQAGPVVKKVIEKWWEKRQKHEASKVARR